VSAASGFLGRSHAIASSSATTTRRIASSSTMPDQPVAVHDPDRVLGGERRLRGLRTIVSGP
jgi:hypothetical protein